VEYGYDKHEIRFISVKQAMWEDVQWPTPDFKFKLFHGQGMFRDRGSGLLDLGLKSARQLWIDLSVVGLFAANIFTRRRQELDWLQ